jgi:hypothetical protein
MSYLAPEIAIKHGVVLISRGKKCNAAGKMKAQWRCKMPAPIADPHQSVAGFVVCLFCSRIFDLISS